MAHTYRHLAALGLLLAVSACGSTTLVASGQANSADPTTPPATDQRSEPITPGGIAALVEEHLGSDRVQRYTTFDSEEELIGVFVHLNGADSRDTFVVNVYSPAEAEGIGPDDSCEAHLARTGEHDPGRCEELPDGSLVTVTSSASGFSDDNEHGSVLMASAFKAPERMAVAMYESHTQTIPVSQKALMDLMSDPRLAWLTDPALNDAGHDITVVKLPR